MHSSLPPDAAKQLHLQLAAAIADAKSSAAEAASLRGSAVRGGDSAAITSRRADSVREPASGLLLNSKHKVLHMRRNPFRNAVRDRRE